MAEFSEIDNQINLLEDEPVEDEEISFSDTDDTSPESLPILLNLDSNSRIVSREGSSHSTLKRNIEDRSMDTISEGSLSKTSSFENIDVSDEEPVTYEPLVVGNLGMNATDYAVANDQVSSASSFSMAKNLFVEECLTDDEYFSEEDESQKPNLLYFKVNRSLPGGISVANLMSAVQDVMNSANKKVLGSLNMPSAFSITSSQQINNSLDLLDEASSPLMTCMEFLKSEMSDGETDVDDLSVESGDGGLDKGEVINLFSFASSKNPHDNQASLTYRGMNDTSSPYNQEERRPSWTLEYLTDDESPNKNMISQENKRKLRRRKLKRSSRAEEFLDQSVTDEEVVDMDKKEFSDGSGMRQVTQIKTETSITLEGDGEGSSLNDEETSATTSMTTTRIVTTVTTNQDSESQQDHDSSDLRHSIEVTLNELMGDAED